MFKIHVYSQTGDIDEEVDVEGDKVIIGRSSECHVVIDRKDISRRHATLLRGWVVDDLNSRNGTYVEGARLETAALVPSRSFEIGDPTSENLVTIEVISSDESSVPAVPAVKTPDPGRTETGHEDPQKPVSTISNMPRPQVSHASGTVSMRAEFQAETERYRYRCAKLEVELDAMRRKLDSLLKDSAERRAASEKSGDGSSSHPPDDRSKRDGDGAR